MVVGKMRRKMMWEMAVLLMILVAVLLPVAEAIGSSDSAIVHGAGEFIFPHGSDAKKLQDKIAGALNSLKAMRSSSAVESGEAEFGGANTTGSLQADRMNFGAVRNDTGLVNGSSGMEGIGINVNKSTDDGLNESINGTSGSSPQGSIDAAFNPTNGSSLEMSGAAGQQGVAANTAGSFKGFYGMTASRHEIGKSGIDSSMFLSGSFSMDKSVKFQDQGI